MKSFLVRSSALTLVLALSGCNSKEQTGAQQSAVQAPAARAGAWTEGAADQLRKAIAGRAAHGLDQMPFDTGGGQSGAQDEASLTRAALIYASALARGATDPAKLYDIYTVARPNPDLKQGLSAALKAGDVGAWLNGLAPADANYRRLSQAYLALRRQPAAPAAAISDVGEPIKPGATDARISAIAHQLVILDYLKQEAAQGDRYAPAMVAAVKAMQADYGMEPDGVIGGEALAILNLSNVDRARAIAVGMERLRWLERTPPATRIDVNLAAGRLSYWRDGKLVDSRKAVVGEPDKETPQLGSPIFRLVANPTWTIPRSIERGELAGKSGSYLRAHNMARKNGWIVQQPGPKNSLGLVKFDMQNEHAIYLHDTPAKAMFALTQRQRSHGCVRVEDALGFSEILARDEGVLDEWHKARATGKETFVKLPHQIPVRMLYQTVLFDESGEPIVRNDPYGWDDRVGAALGFKVGKALRVRTDQADVGP